MLITKLKSKLHRVTVTEINLHYEGSCAIDLELLQAANIEEYEQIHIYNVNTGDRFTTYAIAAPLSSGIVSIRGSAARKAQIGDTLIICTYGICSPYNEKHPSIVYVDSVNKQIQEDESGRT